MVYQPLLRRACLSTRHAAFLQKTRQESCLPFSLCINDTKLNLFFLFFCRAYSSPKTFSNQDTLPRLPIPDLDATAARYKRSLLPLLTASEHAAVSQKIDTFAKGLGPVLQQRLHALDAQEAKLGLSWLDRLWLNKGYLEYRIPTLINVNWWNQFKNPPQGLAPDDSVTPGKASAFQLIRASRMVRSLVDYSNKINR